MPKKTPKADPLPELRYELEGAPPPVFVIRHKPSSTWWMPDEAGYTSDLHRAGTYPEERARKIEKQRGEDEAVPLAQAVREYLAEHVTGANPIVMQAITVAMGAR